MEKYTATFVDAGGEVVRQETVCCDITQHESYREVDPDHRLGLVLDYMDFPALQAHVEGYVETVDVSASLFLIINEEGRLRHMAVNPHEVQTEVMGAGWPPLVGPLVFVRPGGAS